MQIIREIKLEPTANISVVYVPSSPAAGDGLDRGIGSLAFIVDGASSGACYVKTDALATDWTLLAAGAGTYAPLASPAFTGNPTAPTQTLGNSSTRLATTAFVAAAIAAIP